MLFTTLANTSSDEIVFAAFIYIIFRLSLVGILRAISNSTFAFSKSDLISVDALMSPIHCCSVFVPVADIFPLQRRFRQHTLAYIKLLLRKPLR
jgi:hypothetical protein